MPRLKKSQVSTAKQPTILQIEEALNAVAFYALKNKHKACTEISVDCESKRIERCVEEYYVKEDHEMQFLEFAANFLIINYNELVFGVKFNGVYLTGIQNPTNESVDNVEYSVMV